MILFERIMQHMDLLSALTESSNAILMAASKGSFNLVDEISDNRERLVNVIKTFQETIENDIGDLKAEDLTESNVDIIRTWANEVGEIVMLNDNLDRETTIILQGAKEETTKEIASVYKNRQSMKGYDLTSVKK